jgi:hypothetical protein
MGTLKSPWSSTMFPILDMTGGLNLHFQTNLLEVCEPGTPLKKYKIKTWLAFCKRPKIIKEI